MMIDDTPAPFAPTFLGIAICAPAILGVFPVRLALIGAGFGPAWWVAISWQLASAVTWTLLAALLLPRLRHRAAANIAAGNPALTVHDDGAALWPAFLLAVAAHALTISGTTEILHLGRGRPAFGDLLVDTTLLYALPNVMTMLGLIATAIVAAEHRARLIETTLRAELARQLDDAGERVVAALAELNGVALAAANTGAPEWLERITVTIGNRTLVVPVAEIDLIEASSYYAQLHVGARRYLVRQSMNSLEQRLDPKMFARIHRSTIVNLDRVAELRPHDRRSYVVVLKDGRQLMMSRRRRRLLDYFSA